MSGSWFPVPIPGNRGTSSNRFSGTEGNHWEPLSREEKNQRFVRPIACRMPGGSRVGGKRSGSAHLRYVPSTGKCHGKPKDCRCSPAVQSVFGLRDWDRTIDHLGLSRIEEEKPCLCPRRSRPCRRDRGVIGVGPAQRVPLWNRDAECAETTKCARKSTICWPPGPATPRSCAHSRRTMPNSTSGTGSRSIRSETTAGGTSQSRTLPKRPTERSSNAGQRRTRSTSSRAWSPRSRHCVPRDRHGQKL